jgi:hypothetical protein
MNPLATMPQLCSFTFWMQRHASLVKSLDVPASEVARPGMIVHGLPMEHHAAAVQQLLQQMLQLAAAAPESATSASLLPAPAAATTTSLSDVRACAQQQQQQQQRRLRLVRFSSNMLASSSMLAALPAHSLTRLEMDFAFSSSSSLNGQSMSAALAQISNLQQLQLGTSSQTSVPGSCLAGIVQLSQLTSLRLEGMWSELDESLQQLLAQPLPLQQLHLELICTWGSEPVLQLAAQSQLTQLIYSEDLSEQTTLPQQLLHLECWQPQGISFFTVLELQQLQRLRILADSVSQSELLQVAQLPALQQLALMYNDLQGASRAASCWAQLPQLCEFIVDNHGLARRRRLPGVLAGITAATSLTKLVLDGWAALFDDMDVSEDEEADAEGAANGAQGALLADVPTCASLARLPGLRHLAIQSASKLAPDDALALTALTGLTHLALQQYGQRR